MSDTPMKEAQKTIDEFHACTIDVLEQTRRELARVTVERLKEYDDHIEVEAKLLAERNEAKEALVASESYAKLEYERAESAERKLAECEKDTERYRFLRDSQDAATESDWLAIYQDDRCALTGNAADEIIDRFIAIAKESK